MTRQSTHAQFSVISYVSTPFKTLKNTFSLPQRLISNDHWKYYLSVKGALRTIAGLMSDEIRELSRLETVTLNSDLAQGFALKTLTDIFASFVTMKSIKSAYKGRLVSTVLHGYLSLRYLKVSIMKLCVVRTLGNGFDALEKTLPLYAAYWDNFSINSRD